MNFSALNTKHKLKSKLANLFNFKTKRPSQKMFQGKK